MDDEGRVNAFRWLYGVLLRASVPTSSGAINLQTEDAKAAAVWYPGGVYFDHYIGFLAIHSSHATLFMQIVSYPLVVCCGMER